MSNQTQAAMSHHIIRMAYYASFITTCSEFVSSFGTTRPTIPTLSKTSTTRKHLIENALHQEQDGAVNGGRCSPSPGRPSRAGEVNKMHNMLTSKSCGHISKQAPYHTGITQPTTESTRQGNTKQPPVKNKNACITPGVHITKQKRLRHYDIYCRDPDRYTKTKRKNVVVFLFENSSRYPAAPVCFSVPGT